MKSVPYLPKSWQIKKGGMGWGELDKIPAPSVEELKHIKNRRDAEELILSIPSPWARLYFYRYIIRNRHEIRRFEEYEKSPFKELFDEYFGILQILAFRKVLSIDRAVNFVPVNLSDLEGVKGQEYNFYKSLESFPSPFEDNANLTIIKLWDKPIAITSPLTLVVPTAELAEEDTWIKRIKDLMRLIEENIRSDVLWRDAFARYLDYITNDVLKTFVVVSGRAQIEGFMRDKREEVLGGNLVRENIRIERVANGWWESYVEDLDDVRSDFMRTDRDGRGYILVPRVSNKNRVYNFINKRTLEHISDYEDWFKDLSKHISSRNLSLILEKDLWVDTFVSLEGNIRKIYNESRKEEYDTFVWLYPLRWEVLREDGALMLLRDIMETIKIIRGDRNEIEVRFDVELSSGLHRFSKTLKLYKGSVNDFQPVFIFPIGGGEDYNYSFIYDGKIFKFTAAVEGEEVAHLDAIGSWYKVRTRPLGEDYFYFVEYRDIGERKPIGVAIIKQEIQRIKGEDLLGGTLILDIGTSNTAFMVKDSSALSARIITSLSVSSPPSLSEELKADAIKRFVVPQRLPEGSPEFIPTAYYRMRRGWGNFDKGFPILLVDRALRRKVVEDERNRKNIKWDIKWNINADYIKNYIYLVYRLLLDVVLGEKRLYVSYPRGVSSTVEQAIRMLQRELSSSVKIIGVPEHRAIVEYYRSFGGVVRQIRNVIIMDIGGGTTDVAFWLEDYVGGFSVMFAGKDILLKSLSHIENAEMRLRTEGVDSVIDALYGDDRNRFEEHLIVGISTLLFTMGALFREIINASSSSGTRSNSDSNVAYFLVGNGSRLLDILIYNEQIREAVGIETRLTVRDVVQYIFRDIGLESQFNTSPLSDKKLEVCKGIAKGIENRRWDNQGVDRRISVDVERIHQIFEDDESEYQRTYRSFIEVLARRILRVQYDVEGIISKIKEEVAREDYSNYMKSIIRIIVDDMRRRINQRYDRQGG